MIFFLFLQKKGEEGEEVRLVFKTGIPPPTPQPKYPPKASSNLSFVILIHKSHKLLKTKTNIGTFFSKKTVLFFKKIHYYSLSLPCDPIQELLELDDIPPASPRDKKKVHFNLVPMIKTTTDEHPTTTTRIVKKIVRKVQVRRVRQSLHLDF